MSPGLEMETFYGIKEFTVLQKEQCWNLCPCELGGPRFPSSKLPGHQKKRAGGEGV